MYIPSSVVSLHTQDDWVSFLLFSIIFILCFAIISRHLAMRDRKRSKARKNLYEIGIISNGFIILSEGYISSILKAVGSKSYNRRNVSYNFTTKEGADFVGVDTVDVFLEPRLFFAKQGHKIKVIYDSTDPTINLIYFN